jgi:hypothetical protein
MKLQDEAFEEAKRLATKGEDFSVLAGVINPEQRMRLRAFIYNLPEDVARKTIYGRVQLANLPTTTKSRGRPKKQ